MDPDQQEVFQAGYNAAMEAMQVHSGPAPMYADSAYIFKHLQAFHVQFSFLDTRALMGSKHVRPVEDIPTIRTSHIMMPPVAFKSMLQVAQRMLESYEQEYGALPTIEYNPDLHEQVFPSKKDMKTKEVPAVEVSVVNAKELRRKVLGEAFVDGKVDLEWLKCKAKELGCFVYDEDLKSPDRLIKLIADKGYYYRPEDTDHAEEEGPEEPSE